MAIEIGSASLPGPQSRALESGPNFSVMSSLLFFHRPSYLSTRHVGNQFVEDFNLKFAMSLIPEAENALHRTIISSVMLQIFRAEATDLILGGRLIMPIAVVM